MHTAQQLIDLIREGGGLSVKATIAINEVCLQRDMLLEALERLAIVAKGAKWVRRDGDAIEGAESALAFVRKSS